MVSRKPSRTPAKKKLKPIILRRDARVLLSKISDPRTVLVVNALCGGAKRFGELQRFVEVLSPKLLTQTVRQLEAEGFVHREVFAAVPPRVEYSLTETGARIAEPLQSLCAWAAENSDRHR